MENSPKKALKIKEKKSTVAIIWSPEAPKKPEIIPEKVTTPEAPKAATPTPSVFTPRENSKRKPFVPRYVSHSTEKPASEAPKAATPTPFIFTPKSSE